MIHRLLLIPALLLLAACQSVQLDRDFDPNRDFAGYRSWDWKEPAVQYRPDDPRIQSDLTEQRIREAIGDQLDQRGLRPVAAGASADLLVQAWYLVDEREEQVMTSSYGGWGGPWHGFWGGPGITQMRTIRYQVGTLQIDLYDRRDGKLVWRGTGSQMLQAGQPGPGERAAAIRETVTRVLSQYPPR